MDNLNVLFLTPLPGTRLREQMKGENRIALNVFPEDWKYYTPTYPVVRHKHLSLDCKAYADFKRHRDGTHSEIDSILPALTC